MDEHFRFDIYLNNDFFMHVYDLDEIQDIVVAYELIGHKVKIYAVMWGSSKRMLIKVSVYDTDKEVSKNNAPVNDSAFI